ncbi:hypothetical protein K2173_018116 [Erythroxylum novogranatense]|uniref:RRM domain-containing protein n=1 Tax=Erythroxylum novogranatense TaxID=1862640 RepID=A0AAV8U6B0_9ROSI|nr:hypothetical protein K2173_018116 [Erythroxylum novogranatense]
MGSTAEAEYREFLEKVKRTVYIDNLSPRVTESVLITALSQFGVVKSVKFIPNYIESRDIPQCALLEMESQKQAKGVILDINRFSFMVSGMPRPVRARPAQAEMFDERPTKPGRKIHCRWLDSNDPDFEIGKKLKHLTQKHAAEASVLLKQQLEREEKLHRQQEEILKANYKKFELLNDVVKDKTATGLARYYNVKFRDG